MLLTTFYRNSQAYHFLFILITATFLGGLAGYIWGPKTIILKPLGDIFLNLMFTIVVPLVFFSVSSAVTSISNPTRMWKILISMFSVFVITSFIAALCMLIVVSIFPLGLDISLPLSAPKSTQTISIADQLVRIFTVPDFLQLFSRDNMLALIFFSLLVGLATKAIGEKGRILADLFKSGQELSMKLVHFLMYYAPVGFFAYFAVLVGDLGPKLLAVYLRSTVVYYAVAFFYFFIILSIYAYVSNKNTGLRQFWRYISFPAMTALATCSSAASIPPNLEAAEKIGVPAEIHELVIPLGSIIHKDGSVLGGMVKIAFLFGLFHMNFFTPQAMVMAILVSMLVGTVMGAIPSGGMVGEILILSLYGFPPQALIVIAAISILIDPPATLLNVTSNTACSMLVARWVVGKNWLRATNKII